MSFQELKRRYMVEGAEGGSSSSGSDSAIRTYQNCTVIPIINGPPYFRALKTEMNRLGTNGSEGQFIYVAGWWMGHDFSLDGATSSNKLTDLLIQKSRAGVDVRVLGWVLAPQVLQNSRVQSAPEVQAILRVNTQTMRFINALQAEPTLADKACLNILAHPAGAVHLKMVVLGSASQAVGFTGGLDFQSGRHDASWHDVQAQVTGPVVQALFDTFRDMWNEVKRRSPVRLTAGGVTSTSHTSSMPNLPSRTISSSAGSRMHVQSLRTLPQFNFASIGSLGSLAGASLPQNDPLSYAPSGLFEIKRAWQKGISGAQTYIYIEDQAFFSREVFDWINAAVKANPQLRVVLLIGRADPNDQPNNVTEKFFRVAVNDHLLRGLSSAEIDRIGVFSHQSKVIHTKSTIVDDHWAIIGSANAMRRSLYTDFEHSVAFMDEDNRLVGAYRMDLWGTHLEQSVSDVGPALDAWFAIPFRGSGAPSHLNIERLRLPLPPTTLSADETTIYDEIYDADSRQAWGGGLVRLFMRQHGVGSLSP